MKIKRAKVESERITGGVGNAKVVKIGSDMFLELWKSLEIGQN